MGRGLGRGCSHNQQVVVDVEVGPRVQVQDGPVEGIGEDHQVANKDCSLGHELGCERKEGSKIRKAKMTTQGEITRNSEIKEGLTFTLRGSAIKEGGTLNSRWDDGHDMKKINFRDEASRTNFPTPGGFT